MKKFAIIVALMILPLVNAEVFPNQYQNSGYVGWVQQDDGPFPYRITYPSLSDGEGVSMAQNGPFAIVVFFADEGEYVDQYEWLQEGLTRYGYICLVLEDEGQQWEGMFNLLSRFNNESITAIPNSLGMFSLPHVSLAGHGTGAYSAAELYKTGLHEIDGLFGIGLEGSESEATNVEILPRPSSSLFLTGTTDEIAPASENVMEYLEDWPGAWQIMHVLGANHIGYQETDTFFERFEDGESSMGKEEQQAHALNHILPYLNLSLRGDDSGYSTAFNREVKTYSSDSSAYIDENLSLSRLYNITNAQSSQNNLTLNQTFTVSSNVEMRDGSEAVANVTCILADGMEVAGNLSGGISTCELNSSDLPIGNSFVTISIHDNSFSDYEKVLMTRIGTPMELIEPISDIEFDQHSNITIYPSDYAIDPDEEEVLFYSGTIVDGTEIIGINNSGFELNLFHQNEQEWDGTKLMNITMIAGNNDFISFEINVTILPVNDIVFQTDPVPQQQTIEDGASIILNIAEYVTDPEGETILVEEAIEYDGLRISSNNSVVIIDPQSHWYGAELVRLNVWDGESGKIEVTVPIFVEAVNDPIQFTKSIESIEMNEDSTLSIDLGEYAVDVDDDVLVYSVQSNFSIITYSLNGDMLVLYGNDNAFGSESFSVMVDDGSSNSTLDFNLVVMPVPDIPIVQISSIDTTATGVSVLWTISDSDGPEGHIKTVSLAGESIGFDTECNGDKYITCLTNYQFTNHSAGFYTLEVKVWDGFAETWSNIAFQNIEVVEKKTDDVSVESGGLDGMSLQIIAIFLIVVLLLGYAIQSKKQ